MKVGKKHLDQPEPSVIALEKNVPERAKDELSDEEIRALLDRSHPKIREAVNKAGAGLFLLKDMLFVHLGPKALNLLGYSRNRLIGRLGPLEIVSEKHWERLSAYLNDTLNGDLPPHPSCFSFMRGDGVAIQCDVILQRCEYLNRPSLVGVLYEHSEETKPASCLDGLVEISKIIAGSKAYDEKLDLIVTEAAKLFQTQTLTVWRPVFEKRCNSICRHSSLNDKEPVCLHLLRKVSGENLEKDIKACLPAGHFLIGIASKGEFIAVNHGSGFIAIPLPFGEKLPNGVLALSTPKPPGTEARAQLEILANHLGAFLYAHDSEVALRRSQELYSKLFIHSRDAIFMHDLEGRIIDANPRALKMLGYTKKDLLSLNITDLHPTEALRDSSQAFETIAREGSVSFQMKFKRKDGTTFPAEVSSSLFQIDGKPVIQGIVRDVSERWKVESALRESEHEKGLILDSITELVTFQDTELNVRWANKSAGQSVNANPAELVGRKCYEIWHQREEPCEGCPVVVSIQEGMRSQAEVTTPDGRAWLIKANPVWNNDGKIVGVVEVTLEVTQRRREEEARKRRETELRIHNEIASAFLKAEDDSAYEQVLQVLMDATESKEGILGYLTDEGSLVCSIRSGPAESSRGDSSVVVRKECCPEIWQKALASRKIMIWNQETQTLDSLPPVQRALVVPIVDEKSPIGILVLTDKPTDYGTRDRELIQVVAERVAPILKARLARAREERKRLQAQAEKDRMQENLVRAQKMEAIGRLASGIAHDFNNILAAIQGFCDLIMMRVDSDSAIYRDLRQIREASLRGNNLTKQLLLFSRSQPLELAPININEIVQGIAEMVSRLLGEDISLSVSLEPEIWTVRGDQSQIEQMIMNLVVNARDAMTGGGCISIRTQNAIVDEEHMPPEAPRAGRYVCLSVTDEGEGIDSGILKNIFDPFYTTKDKGRGTGLGLSVVNGIVERHGGWIIVKSEIGVGTTFNVFLPAQLDLSQPFSQEDDDPVGFCGDGECVLVVEDEDPVRLLLKRALGENNYVVLEAANSEEALRTFESHKDEIQLVLSDVVLTDSNGIDLVERILSIKPDIRVLMTSGYANGKSQLQRISDHGFRFLPKPFKLVELLRSVKAALK